jgi:site-specific DNA-cytosine methylase
MEDSNKDRCIQVGNIYPDSENMANRSGGRVNSTTGCAPTILSRDFKQPKMIMEEVKIGAMRGRNPDNPSEMGKSNGNYQQRLEVNENGTSNTLTSVQKDNLVCEPIIYDDYNSRIAKDQNVMGTITTNVGSSTPRNGYKLFIPEATAKGYAEATDGDSVNLEQPNSKTRRGRVGKQMANTLTTSCNQGVVVSEPKIEPLNPYKDGTCRTIKAQYQQSSRANFARQDGLGATGVVQIGNIYPDTESFKNRVAGRIYSAEGLSPTLRTVTGGHNEPKVVKDWQTVVGNKQLNPFRGSVEGTSPCITSACGAGGGMTPMLTDADLETTKTKEFIEQVRGHEPMRYRIRKLTPRECFRLMGCDEETIDIIQAAGISNSQQYKLAGNSIVVDVLYHLFRKMFVETENESQQLTLF